MMSRKHHRTNNHGMNNSSRKSLFSAQGCQDVDVRYRFRFTAHRAPGLGLGGWGSGLSVRGFSQAFGPLFWKLGLGCKQVVKRPCTQSFENVVSIRAWSV